MVTHSLFCKMRARKMTADGIPVQETMVGMDMGNSSKNRNRCVNCLHCKQSRLSSLLIILAFCEKKAERNDKDVAYWETKKTCRLFNDMETE